MKLPSYFPNTLPIKCLNLLIVRQLECRTESYNGQYSSELIRWRAAQAETVAAARSIWSSHLNLSIGYTPCQSGCQWRVVRYEY